MYKTVNAASIRKRVELPEDYTIDGLLVAGTWDLFGESKHLPQVKLALRNLGIDGEINRIPGEHLGHAYEILARDKKYWFVPQMGTAYVSQYAHMASILGSQKNILCGVVGGLAKGLKPGSFIIPSYAVGNQNALMYQREVKDLKFYPDKALSEKLKTRLGSGNFHEGPTVTCEVMLAETEEDVNEWSKAGFLGVEMEAALIFALSDYFKIPSCALLYVADNLIEEVTIFHDKYDESLTERQNAKQKKYDIALAELLDLPI